MSWVIRASIVLAMLFAQMGVMAQNRSAEAAPIATQPFERTWQRTDKPVLDGSVSRTWMWGPEPFTDGTPEPYSDAPGGERQVQYYDKSRMEDNRWRTNEAPWDVTNGLLVVEMVEGWVQRGDDEFDHAPNPAQVNIVGDPGERPTYADINGLGLRDAPAVGVGATITATYRDDNTIGDDPAYASRGVTGAEHVVETGHTVASPFWAFMLAEGVAWQDGGIVTDQLFINPFYATGLPITEAYWATVAIGGTEREVLWQCFERRCLTYAPDNAPAWRVEAGNVGLHYYEWRYGQSNVEDGPSDLANELAAQVPQAANDDERYNALLEVMDALHVGVYAGDGTMILGGAEWGAGDFYLYDIELRMMAAALGRGETWGVIDLAMQLTELGLLPEGAAVDPELLRQALLDGVAASRATPDEHSSLAALIARQMVLAGQASVDLFTDVSLEQMRLDALSYFLMLAGASLPLVAEQLPVTDSSSEMIAHSNGVLKPASNHSGCEPEAVFNPENAKTAWGWTKIAAELLKKFPQAVGNVTPVLDAVHGAVLAFSVSVTELEQRVATHYGHESPGQPLTFRIKVEMRDALPDTLVNCGWIVGTSYPEQGPIPEVSVHWFWGGLDQHGTVSCGAACVPLGDNGVSIAATGVDGIATMTFQPKQEENPGEGWVVEESGVVTGIALYQSAFTNLLGAYAQYLTPKSGATRWFVERHQEPGWEVTLEVDYDVSSTWKHDQGFGDYLIETADGSGTQRAELFIPATTVAGGGAAWITDGSVTGSGAAARSSTAYPEDHDVWFWEYNCSGSYRGDWGANFHYGEIFRDNGERIVLSGALPGVSGAPWDWFDVSGTGLVDEAPCDLLLFGSTQFQSVEQAVMANVPPFSLDQQGEQHFVMAAAPICDAIRQHRIDYWGGVSDVAAIQQACDVDVEWTIEVRWAGQP